MYINAFIKGDTIKIVERIDGSRILKEDNLDYSFFTLDPYGDYKTIFGDPCTKHTFQRRSDLYLAKKQYPSDKIFEDDLNPTFVYLSKNYNFDDIPDLNIAFYDIEVGFNKETRYSNSDKAENPIISISVYQKWTGNCFILALPPDTMNFEECELVLAEVEKNSENTRCLLFDNEPDLIKTFLVLIEDSDVISGWNSEHYDFRYICNRIPKIMEKYYLKNLCLFGEYPIRREIVNDKTKSRDYVYNPVGRSHLDYMLLYKKYTYNELTSFSLDNVSMVELGERKVEYNGTLDDLYKKDFKKFIEYNIKDTMLIERLDEKLKFIDLCNLVAHNNGVLMETTLGTVAMTEQAIINEGHYYSDEYLVFPSRPEKKDNVSGAAGAYVTVPKVGIKKLVAGNDINSLYPSVIRALNMSPETIIGQIDDTETEEYIISQVESGIAKNFTEAWSPLFNIFEYDYIMEGSEDKQITLHFNDKNPPITASAKDIKEFIFSNEKVCLSANGTLFSREKIGIIPKLLTRWYADRKKMQKKAEKYEKLLSEETDPVKKKEYESLYKFWDQRQLAKKINLNALYGALLNSYCRFYDKRLGQSTTLTGRSVCRHMSSRINELITGKYDNNGDAIVYGDTDSVVGSTVIQTNHGPITIEELFEECSINWNNNDKEYACDERYKVLSYNPEYDRIHYEQFNYVYRHKTKKVIFRITDENDNIIEITDDHSVMVERNGEIMEIKPSNLRYDDVLITLVGENNNDSL